MLRGCALAWYTVWLAICYQMYCNFQHYQATGKIALHTSTTISVTRSVCCVAAHWHDIPFDVLSAIKCIATSSATKLHGQSLFTRALWLLWQDMYIEWLHTDMIYFSICYLLLNVLQLPMLLRYRENHSLSEHYDRCDKIRTLCGRTHWHDMPFYMLSATKCLATSNATKLQGKSPLIQVLWVVQQYAYIAWLQD